MLSMPRSVGPANLRIAVSGMASSNPRPKIGGQLHNSLFSDLEHHCVVTTLRFAGYWTRDGGHDEWLKDEREDGC
ncbi:MAG: hypothetical protein M2R46_04880 [Verrucomicrobia subdivision 3 bacterium]|nr:hypothetical protein [Limisphaerales bacterium]